jgi:membrane complex biogenesis BtpA family protein
MDRQGQIRSIFGTPRALIGMIHVAALPGTPGSELEVEAIATTAVEEAQGLQAAGFHGLLIENMHDRPYLKKTVGPEIVASMAAVGGEIRQAVPLPLGVQILAGANREAIAVALACGGAFVRAEGFVFAHVADEGLLESDAGELLRYRRAIGAEGIKVFADIKKKHSAHALTTDVDLVETARAAELFLADGLVVTGTATGRPAEPAEVEAVQSAVDVPTLVGSGISAENLERYGAAEGLIVGSWLKKDGLWSNPPDPARLEAVVRAFEKLPVPDESPSRD